mmetsp:Transcript_2889/g.18007  ORF Transcript_2889/g.18007 Transcript_2889/m.18007 type:complete len:120 (-) Transcript_2889:2205-2564(-)
MDTSAILSAATLADSARQYPRARSRRSKQFDLTSRCRNACPRSISTTALPELLAAMPAYAINDGIEQVTFQLRPSPREIGDRTRTRRRWNGCIGKIYTSAGPNGVSIFLREYGDHVSLA